MNQDRFAGLFSNQRRENGHPVQDNLRGFTTNPLGDSVTAAQALMYQAAYQRALEENQEPENQEPEWPLAESWN